MIPVTVTARHCEIENDLRDRAETMLQRLAEVSPFAQEGAVVFDTVPLGGMVELRLHLSGGRILVARAEADVHRSALDQAADRLRRQLEHPAARARGKGRGAA